MKCSVFYSWQSDLSNASNRGLILDALERAVKAICGDSTIAVEPVVDRDTAGVPGSPEIGATIFEKIDKCAAFVCDVSIINAATDDRRPTPNPNVLIELGYALKSRGQARVLLVMNKNFGDVDKLPFDLRTKRVIKYEMATNAAERAPERQKLQRTLEAALREMLALPHPETRTRAGYILSADARELLLEAAKDRSGSVSVTTGCSYGVSVATNQRQFTTDLDSRSAARWKAAVANLVDLGLLVPSGNTGQVNRLTHEGYRVAEELSGRPDQ
jgi:hypothetical protein